MTEREKIVAWLREQADKQTERALSGGAGYAMLHVGAGEKRHIANRIERGEHLNEGEEG